MRALVISLLLIPGIPGGIVSKWAVDLFRREEPATGHMEEFLFFTMIWAATFWVTAIGLLIWKLAF